MTNSSKVLLIISCGLLLAIVCNVHGMRKVRGAEHALVPITYQRHIHTIHIHCIDRCGTYTKVGSVVPEYLEYKDYTGLRSWEVQKEPLRVLVKEIDERLVMTMSVLLVFVAGVGFVSGYGARKTN